MKLEAVDGRCPHDATHEMVGVEIRGVYDGILFWRCAVDGTDVHRWPEGDRLHAVTEDLWRRWAQDRVSA